MATAPVFKNWSLIMEVCMDILLLVLLLACFGSAALLTLWCDNTATRQER